MPTYFIFSFFSSLDWEPFCLDFSYLSNSQPTDNSPDNTNHLGQKSLDAHHPGYLDPVEVTFDLGNAAAGSTWLYKTKTQLWKWLALHVACSFQFKKKKVFYILCLYYQYSIADNGRKVSFFLLSLQSEVQPYLSRLLENTDWILTVFDRVHLCESWGGHPGLLIPNRSYGLCGCKATLKQILWSQWA